jgi:hypothetical protein
MQLQHCAAFYKHQLRALVEPLQRQLPDVGV